MHTKQTLNSLKIKQSIKFRSDMHFLKTKYSKPCFNSVIQITQRRQNTQRNQNINQIEKNILNLTNRMRQLVKNSPPLELYQARKCSDSNMIKRNWKKKILRRSNIGEYGTIIKGKTSMSIKKLVQSHTKSKQGQTQPILYSQYSTYLHQSQQNSNNVELQTVPYHKQKIYSRIKMKTYQNYYTSVKDQNKLTKKETEQDYKWACEPW